MRNVIPIEIAAPTIMQQNRYALHSNRKILLLDTPNCLSIGFLPMIAIMVVAMTQKIMANFA